MLATDFLADHHRMLHRLMNELEAAPRHDLRTRQRLTDVLMAELQMHDQVEDELFYPAMRDVSVVVPTLHAEQRQIVDQLSVLLRIRPTTERFDEELRLLKARFEHHSFLEEEGRMFPEVARIVSPWDLEATGQRLAHRLDHLRSSRLARWRRRGKRALLRWL